MFWFHTPVLDDASPGCFCPSNSFVVVNTELELDDLDIVTGEGFVDDSSNLRTRSKDVHDVDLLLNIRERIVSRLSKNLICSGIDRNDFVPLRLEIFRDLVGVLAGR